MSEDATPLVEALLTIVDAARVYLECAPCGRRGRYNVARDRYRWNEEVERVWAWSLMPQVASASCALFGWRRRANLCEEAMESRRELC
jgi:hypothetical protein